MGFFVIYHQGSSQTTFSQWWCHAQPEGTRLSFYPTSVWSKWFCPTIFWLNRPSGTVKRRWSDRLSLPFEEWIRFMSREVPVVNTREGMSLPPPPWNVFPLRNQDLGISIPLIDICDPYFFAVIIVHQIFVIGGTNMQENQRLLFVNTRLCSQNLPSLYIYSPGLLC